MEEGNHYCVLDSSLSVCVWQETAISIAPEVEYMDFMCSKEVPVYMFTVARRK